jgi:hypothetical protein
VWERCGLLVDWLWSVLVGGGWWREWESERNAGCELWLLSGFGSWVWWSGTSATQKLWQIMRMCRNGSEAFCVVGNFIYLLERDMEHVLRNVLPFWLVMKGRKNLPHRNRVGHTTLKGHSLRNVVKFLITYEMEPGTTYNAKETRIKSAWDFKWTSTSIGFKKKNVL